MASCSGAVHGAEIQTTVAGDGDATVQRDAPLVLDLGCGNGVFLAGLAAAQSGWNVLGIEKKEYRVRQARRRVEELPNARVLHGEVSDLLSGFPDGSIARVYLLFSDPWPKRRHAVRRLVQDDFVALMGAKLEHGGMFFFATDAVEYLVWARERFAAAGWQLGDWILPTGWPMTEFEQRFVADGVQIGRFQAQR